MTHWSAQEWINRGATLVAQDPRLGQRLISRGVQLAPEEPIGWFNLGLALHERGLISGAIRSYRQALRLSNPPLSEAVNNLAQDLLLNGDWVEGWRLYEQRFARMETSFSLYRSMYGDVWQGFQDPRPCDHLIVVSEQGLGDTLQFSRLLPSLHAHGMKASLFCQEPLAPLLRNSSAIGDVVVMLNQQGPSIRWCPLLSLPDRLGLTPETVPLANGYIQPEAERIDHWRTVLKRKPGYRLVALHWQGNPKFERKLYSRGRSMPFNAWLGLRGLENVEFLSIQKGEGQKQVRTDAGLAFVDGQHTFDASFDFRDTAAALANCDLLLSADSSVVHLAGAIGLPTWIALSHVPEWRWGLRSETTPWYASARLFRQPSPGDWDSVVKTMREALHQPGS